MARSCWSSGAGLPVPSMKPVRSRLLRYTQACVSRATAMWPFTAWRKLYWASQRRSFSSEWTQISSSSWVPLATLPSGDS